MWKLACAVTVLITSVGCLKVKSTDSEINAVVQAEFDNSLSVLLKSLRKQDESALKMSLIGSVDETSLNLNEESIRFESMSDVATYVHSRLGVQAFRQTLCGIAVAAESTANSYIFLGANVSAFAAGSVLAGADLVWDIKNIRTKKFYRLQRSDMWPSF